MKKVFFPYGIQTEVMTKDIILEPSETRSISETLDRSLPLLWNAIQRAGTDSPFWNSRFCQQGIEPSDICGLDKFTSIPLLDKADVLKDQIENAPFGTLNTIPQEKLIRIHRTSGTTSEPLLVYLTPEDLSNVIKAGRLAFLCAGIEPSDVVIHCLNYCMWAGGVTDHQCLEAAGATVIPFGVGNSSFLLNMILRTQPTALSCTPSYLTRLKQLLNDDFGLLPTDLKLKSAFLGGEGGLQDITFRKAIEDEWGIRAIDANYGLSEILSIIASECIERDGLHFHAHEILFPELIDEKGRSINISKGAIGELVLSNLVRQAQPLFRYRTHDLVEIISDDLCTCGRQGFRFKVIDRTDDMVIVKGVNFFPNVLQGYFSDRRWFTGEYRVYVPKPPIHELRVDVERASNPNRVDWTSLANDLIFQIAELHSIKISIRFVDYGSIPKTVDKTKRLIRE